jgi:molybdopterin-containing oxidoreductase family iron-sulfur binding subunit
MSQENDSTGQSIAVLSGRTYWRSLDHLADTPAFREWVEQSFPDSMRELLAGGIDRRRFLELMAASIGLGGLAGCRRPELKVVPYSRPPEEVIPGLPLFYATAMPRSGAAFPVLVESHEGRPTKVEGNPRQPDSGGTSDALAQAWVLELYDPDRAGPVLKQGQPSSWRDYDLFAAPHYATIQGRKGRGLRVLSDDPNSPALDLLREHFGKVLPEAKWHVFEPCFRPHRSEGAALAFGKPLQPRYHFDKAQVILSMDGDFLGTEEDGTRHHRGFAAGRLGNDPAPTMNRLYVVESQFTITGSIADHRLRLPSSQVTEFTLTLARELLDREPVAPANEGSSRDLRRVLATFEPAASIDKSWVREVAADLRAHAGRGLIVAGHRQPPLVHALAFALNALLGNLDKTVEFRKLPARPSSEPLDTLVKAIDRGEVETLLIVGGNPAYNAPADFEFADRMKKVATTIRLGLHADETSRLATWHLPAAHPLESWGDARAGDGSLLAIQPLIEPLFEGRPILEELARLTKYEVASPYEIVRHIFKAISKVADVDLEAAWRKFLHHGSSAAGAYAREHPTSHWDELAQAVSKVRPAPVSLSANCLELVLERDPKVDDGRYANNGWLQELCNPMTKLAWGNAALLSPRTARELNVRDGDVIRLELNGRALETAAMILPGQADYSVGLSLGYGRTACGRVGQGIGSNAYLLRASESPDLAVGARITPTERRAKLASNQEHFTMEGRDLVRELTLADLIGRSAEHGSSAEVLADIHTVPSSDGEHQWGMAIDLNTCTGCSACVLACQSENNIPIVGPQESSRGREMHWIRIDRYFAGDPDDPAIVHQPVACVHCEKAPCEIVCPVNATVHGDEGLNIMVYSRCVGTRYCSNNCPYKVRRFNYFDYHQRPLDQLWSGPLAPQGMPETLKLQKNPDVSVRMRGVMEKCTYCVQRIERAKIGMKVAAGGSPPGKIPDGTVIPACAQACPAEAIVFGDLSDPASKVSRIKNQSRNYDLLGELNTKPRTSYLGRLRNPNPRMSSRPVAPGGEQA